MLRDPQLQYKIQSMYDWVPFPLCSELLRVSGPMARKDSFPGKAVTLRRGIPGRGGTVDVKGRKEDSFLVPGHSLHDSGVH